MSAIVKDITGVEREVPLKAEVSSTVASLANEDVALAEKIEAVETDLHDNYVKNDKLPEYVRTADLQEAVNNEIDSRNLAEKSEVDAVKEDLTALDTKLSGQLAEWIRNHNEHGSDSGCDCENVRTRIIYKDETNQEVTVIIPGTVTECVEHADHTVDITYVDNDGNTKNWETLSGPVVLLQRERAVGNDNYEALTNLPYIIYTDETGEHKVYIRGDVTEVFKKLLPATAKIRYNNKLGKVVEKEVIGTVDITDIGIGEKKSLITYNGNDGEVHEDRLDGVVTEYVYDETTKKTTLKWEDQEGNEQVTEYDGDVIKVVFGYDTQSGTSDYRMLEHLPTITWVDEETGNMVTHVLRGDVTDDVTDLLQHVASGSKLTYTDPETGEEKELKGNIDEWLATAFSALEVEDLWNTTTP